MSRGCAQPKPPFLCERCIAFFFPLPPLAPGCSSPFYLPTYLGVSVSFRHFFKRVALRKRARLDVEVCVLAGSGEREGPLLEYSRNSQVVG